MMNRDHQLTDEIDIEIGGSRVATGVLDLAASPAVFVLADTRPDAPLRWRGRDAIDPEDVPEGARILISNPDDRDVVATWCGGARIVEDKRGNDFLVFRAPEGLGDRYYDHCRRRGIDPYRSVIGMMEAEIEHPAEQDRAGTIWRLVDRTGGSVELFSGKKEALGRISGLLGERGRALVDLDAFEPRREWIAIYEEGREPRFTSAGAALMFLREKIAVTPRAGAVELRVGGLPRLIKSSIKAGIASTDGAGMISFDVGRSGGRSETLIMDLCPEIEVS